MARKKPGQNPSTVTYPHFRYYRKSKHPALITEERSQDEYNYRKVMHSENRQNVSNELLTKGEKRAIWAYHKYDFDKKNYCKIPWVKNVP